MPARNANSAHNPKGLADPSGFYRVLMIAPTSFFLDYGCHVRILEEARVLQSLGHRVKIVTYPLGRNLPDLDIERALPIPFRSRRETGPSRSKLLIDALLAFKALTVALRFKPDLIHAHLHEGALIGGVLSRLLRAPLVFDFQGSLTSEMVDHRFIAPHGILFSLAHAIEWWIDRLPQKIFTSSENALRVLTQDFAVDAARVMALHDGVHADTFTRVNADDLRARLAIPRARKIIVYIGLLAPYRGTDVLLEAARQLLARGVDAHFIIVGFPNVEHYQARARALGIGARTSFVGRVPYEDVPLWLSLGDVVVEPKMSATEAAGKVLNYMALGLPVVAFDIPVMREYLGELGVYAPLGDATAFAQQIEALLDEPARAEKIGRALRARVIEKFAWTRAGREIEKVYAALLARKK